ncbi:TOMM precursor leader peptide-binding protein [Actinospica durhamensis]|uniref:TOMM leader peptide-binding protein n=1 Tax=Actinospica durhamensis TaxID=1508375 RepID=A0A941EMN6_9ACTN|nr:TOMM precursor leader peptide-binding protein [Actinospica durhamensis]MBR7833193.1 TOMM precursor leader peptide-binding protein [Actinospica durhamensis]
MRPVLKPGVTRVWLDPGRLRLGLGSGRERVYRLEPPLRRLLEACDGTRDLEALLGYGERLGLARDRALALIDRFALDGVLDDAALSTPELARMGVAERGRLGPLVAALGLRHPLPGGGARALERRVQRQVAVHGLGLVGAQVARQLAAAGIGVVRPVDPAPVEPADTAPGALAPAEVGQRRQDAVGRAILAFTPSVRTAPSHHHRPPDLAVIAPAEQDPAELIEELAGQSIPYLLIRMGEDEAMVGPLVLPGRTPCARCAEEQLAESEPDAARAFAQPPGPPPNGHVPPRDAALALLAAAYGVLHALAFLDGPDPGVLGSVLRFSAGDPTARRIPVAAHRNCRCGASPGVLVGIDLLE